MARIRTIKPAFWRSPDVMQLDHFQRLLFIGLWNLADDYGRGVLDPASIGADLFLTEYSVSPHDVVMEVSNAFSEYSKRGMCHIFSVGNREFFEIANWNEHQRVNRPSKSNIPSSTHPEAQFKNSPGGLIEDSLNPHGALTLGIRNKEQGIRNKDHSCSPDGEHTSTPKNPYPKDFESWWALYPKKVGKRKALEAWKRARQRVDGETLAAATRNFAAFHQREGTPKQFIKDPQGWLNRDGWEDELVPRQPRRGNDIADWLPSADAQHAQISPSFGRGATITPLPIQGAIEDGRTPENGTGGAYPASR